MRYLFLLLLALPSLLSAQAPLPPGSTSIPPLAQLTPADTVILASAPTPSPLPTDTLRPASVAVPDTLLTTFQGLSEAQRQSRGRADARRHYRARGVFWTGAGLGLVMPVVLTPISTPVVGLTGSFGSALSLGLAGPDKAKLQAAAPQPALLNDASYRRGYTTKAYEKRLGKTMLGWGVGTATLLTTVIVALAIAFSNFSFGG